MGKDGFLTMSEVAGLDMQSELTILSACNTYGGEDKIAHGEGFAGLTRSFMYAGSRSLLVTQWKVESQTTKDLIVQMFQTAKDSVNPQALREAKLLIKNSARPFIEDPSGKLSLSHPFFWASFVFVGGKI